MMWAKFKDFFRKNLADDWAFANSICSKFRWDSQYQAESILDWAVHLEHLQSILLEYDPVGAPTKPIMLRYFREGLKPSVLAKLEHQDLELESFDPIVKKAVDAEANSALQPHFSTKKIDQNCPRGNRPANSTIAKSQGSALKDPWTEKPKVRGTESASGPPQHSNNNKFSDKTRKKKKKEWHRKNQERQKSSTSATGVNSAYTSESHQKKKNQGCLDRASRDTSQIKY